MPFRGRLVDASRVRTRHIALVLSVPSCTIGTSEGNVPGVACRRISNGFYSDQPARCNHRVPVITIAQSCVASVASSGCCDETVQPGVDRWRPRLKSFLKTVSHCNVSIWFHYGRVVADKSFAVRWFISKNHVSGADNVCLHGRPVWCSRVLASGPIGNLRERPVGRPNHRPAPSAVSPVLKREQRQMRRVERIAFALVVGLIAAVARPGRTAARRTVLSTRPSMTSNRSQRTGSSARRCTMSIR